VDKGAEGTISVMTRSKRTVGEGLIGATIKSDRLGLANTVVSDSGNSLQLSNVMGRGGSGSPVVNTKGQVIGVFSSMKSDGSTVVNFAVPIEYVNSILE
jgi:S1-C subfamily serine protease